MRILHIDIEGGYGGSSRSLNFLVERLKKKPLTSEVWFKKEGPSYKKSKNLKINCKVNKNIAHIIPLKKNNLKNIILSSKGLLKLPKLAKEIVKLDIDILHLNYEGLLPLCLLLKLMRFKKKIIVHVRHVMPKNFYSKIFVKLFRLVDGVIFISKMEKDNLLRIDNNALLNKPNIIVYNCASYKLLNYKPNYNKNFYTAIFLGTIDRLRAPDRIIKIAKYCVKNKLPIKFNIFGKEGRKSILKSKNAVTIKSLKLSVESNNLNKVVFYRGFSANPEKNIMDSDILIRPDRSEEPWGRDVIESMAAGLLVIASGKEKVFIRNNLNGLLFQEWDEKKVAKKLALLLKDKEQLKKIRKKAKEFAKNNFKPSMSAEKVYFFFRKLIEDN